MRPRALCLRLRVPPPLPAFLIALQAIKYLRFATIQRNLQIKDLETEINDFKESRVHDDDTYSSEDVRELITSLQKTLRADTYRDLQRVAHSTVVLLRQCLEQAAQHGVAITIDTGLLQDEKFLLEAKRIDEESERTPEATKALAPTASGSPATITPSLQHAAPKAFAHIGHGTDLVAASGVGKLMKLPGLESAKTAEALGLENAILKERLADLQRELVEVNREKTQLGDRLRAAEAAMANSVVPANGPDTVLASPAGTATAGASLAPLAPLGGGSSSTVRAGGLAPIGGIGSEQLAQLRAHVTALEDQLKKAGVQPAAAPTSPTSEDKLLGGGKAPVSGRGMSDCAVPSAFAGDDGNERVVYVGEAGSHFIISGGAGAGEVAELQVKLKAAEAELQAKQAEVAALQEQMELRINQTPQFKSLNQVGCFSVCRPCKRRETE